MSITDEAVAANQNYAREFKLGHLPMPPAKRLAILACMDARLTIEPMLGLKTSEAHIIRNAGGIVTEDALRSLIISHHLLGTQEFIVINHTDCGMLTFKDEELRSKLTEQTGNSAHHRDQQRFQQKLAHKPRAAGADREAHRDLFLPPRRARQQQVGDVRACD